MTFALYFLRSLRFIERIYSTARVHRGQSTPDNSQLRFRVYNRRTWEGVCVSPSHTSTTRARVSTPTFIEPPYATMQSIITRSWINVQPRTKAFVDVSNVYELNYIRFKRFHSSQPEFRRMKSLISLPWRGNFVNLPLLIIAVKNHKLLQIMQTKSYIYNPRCWKKIRKIIRRYVRTHSPCNPSLISLGAILGTSSRGGARKG